MDLICGYSDQSSSDEEEAEIESEEVPKKECLLQILKLKIYSSSIKLLEYV